MTKMLVFFINQQAKHHGSRKNGPR
jgi:hypothetical protein